MGLICDVAVCRLTPKGSNGTGSGLLLGSLSFTKTQQPRERYLPLVLVFEYRVEIRAGRVFSLRNTLLEAELTAPSDLSSAFAPLHNRHMMGCTRFATLLMILSGRLNWAELLRVCLKSQCSIAAPALNVAARMCCF